MKAKDIANLYIDRKMEIKDIADILFNRIERTKKGDMDTLITSILDCDDTWNRIARHTNKKIKHHSSIPPLSQEGFIRLCLNIFGEELAVVASNSEELQKRIARATS